MKDTLKLILSIILIGCGDLEKDAPLPPPNLDARNAVLKEVEEKIALLDQATTEQVIALMDHKDHRVRRAALKRLGALKESPDVSVNALVKALNDKDDDVRVQAAIALTNNQNESATKPLIRALVDPNSRVRLWSYKALKKLGSQAVPEMIRQISAESDGKEISYTDSVNRKQTLHDILIDSLSKMGRAAVPHLIETIKTQTGQPAQDAIELLGKIGREASEGIHALLKILNTSDDAELKKRAIIAVGQIGDVDPEVVPTLMSLSEDTDNTIANEAAKMLKKLEENS
jgi:HEAT repeat protein